MATKKIGLTDFSKPKTAIEQQTAEDSTPQQSIEERQRGKGALVSIHIRLTREQWEKLHHFAVIEGKSLQKLTLLGFSKLFKEKGLDF